MLFQFEEWRDILKWNQRIKKQVWKIDNYVYFLKKVLHIYNFTEDGFVSFSTFQCCAPFWLHSENATLWLKFCQFSFIWFTKSLLYSFVNFKIWLAESLFRHAIKIYKPPPFLEYICLPKIKSMNQILIGKRSCWNWHFQNFYPEVSCSLLQKFSTLVGFKYSGYHKNIFSLAVTSILLNEQVLSFLTDETVSHVIC